MTSSRALWARIDARRAAEQAKEREDEADRLAHPERWEETTEPGLAALGRTFRRKNEGE